MNYYRFYNIPKRIHIFGHNIDILWNENLAADDSKTGISDFRRGTITIQPSCIQMNRTYDSVQRTYYHEVIHFILALLDYSDLTFDEHFVELVAGGLHQVISTAEFEEIEDEEE